MDTTKVEEDVKSQLESAITAENYSEAAKIKEKLKQLKPKEIKKTKVEESLKLQLKYAVRAENYSDAAKIEEKLQQFSNLKLKLDSALIDENYLDASKIITQLQTFSSEESEMMELEEGSSEIKEEMDTNVKADIFEPFASSTPHKNDFRKFIIPKRKDGGICGYECRFIDPETNNPCLKRSRTIGIAKEHLVNFHE